ncbi:MAG: hypothetical protein WBD22_00710 [Pyrinomonadaceae bacterium]
MSLYKYLVLDAAFNGTGIRTDFTSSDVELDSLEISENLKRRITSWLADYHEQQFQGFENTETAEGLDLEGVSIVKELRAELPGVKISYYSEVCGSRLLV